MLKSMAQHRGGDLLGGRLSHAACDADHPQIRPAAMDTLKAADPLQAGDRVVYNVDQRHAQYGFSGNNWPVLPSPCTAVDDGGAVGLGNLASPFFADNRRSARRQNAFEVVVAVRILTDQRHEEIAGPSIPTVQHGSLNRPRSQCQGRQLAGERLPDAYAG